MKKTINSLVLGATILLASIFGGCSKNEQTDPVRDATKFITKERTFVQCTKTFNPPAKKLNFNTNSNLKSTINAQISSREVYEPATTLNKIYYYGYANGKLTQIYEYDAIGNYLGEVDYYYDEVGRLQYRVKFDKSGNYNEFYQYWYDEFNKLIWLDTYNHDGTLSYYLEYNYSGNTLVQVNTIDRGISTTTWNYYYNSQGLSKISTIAGGSLTFSYNSDKKVSKKSFSGYGHTAYTNYVYYSDKQCSYYYNDKRYISRDIYFYEGGLTSNYSPSDPLNIFNIDKLP